MKAIPNEVVHFFAESGFGVVSTSDKQGRVHSSIKGIIRIDAEGGVYLLDLYKQRTLRNLKENPYISITGVDEHRFIGYTLEGAVEIVEDKATVEKFFDHWKQSLTKRITTRVIRNVRGRKGHPEHPETQLPAPEYLIKVNVEKVIDLAPKAIKNNN